VLLLAALPRVTRPLQHLLVFLLTHALTALLNQRSHEVDEDSEPQRGP
jgi:hypothetical protein